MNRIWQRQVISKELSSALGSISKAAFVYLTDTAGTRNVTEWAKKLECWEGFRSTPIDIPNLSAELVKSVSRPAGQAGGGTTVIPAGKSWADLFEAISQMKTDTWSDLSKWGKSTGKLAPWQTTLCLNFFRKLERGKKPTFPECKAALEMLEAARGKGFDK